VLHASPVRAVLLIAVAVLVFGSGLTMLIVDGPGSAGDIDADDVMAVFSMFVLSPLFVGLAVHVLRTQRQIVLTDTGFSHPSHPDVRWTDVGPFLMRPAPGGSHGLAHELVTTLHMTGPHGEYLPEQLTLPLFRIVGHSAQDVVDLFNEYRDRASTAPA
jgi:hypothetical protein